MDTPESRVHSFIVKLWLEEPGDERSKPVWHGYVTHVPSEDRRYLLELSDIVSFIKTHVAEIGVDFTHETRGPRWLKSWKRRKP